MIITEATIAPNPVNAGATIYISVAISDPDTWLLDSQDNFLIDSSGAFLLSKE